MNLIKFSRDTKMRKDFFTAEHFAHPAKMDAQLLIWIIEKWTSPGDLILDPMAGSGTTMLCCQLGRHCILIDLESKFVDMMKGNWEKIQQRGCQLGYSMGTATILQGDARNLTGILCDKIITSPPYNDSPTGGGLNTKPPREGYNDQSGRSMSQSQIGAGKYDKIITSPPFQEAEIRRSGQEASRQNYSYGSKLKMSSEHPDNISKLAETAYGSIDAVIKDLQISRHSGIIEYDECEGQATSGECKKASAGFRECGEASPMVDRQLSERDSGAESGSRASEYNSIRSAQDTEISRDASKVKGKRGQPTPKLAGRLEEISRFKLADPTQESTGAGQLPVSDMSRTNRPSSSSDTLPDKQGQQLDQFVKPLCSLPRQGNGINPQSNHQDTPQTLQAHIDCVISSPPYESAVKHGDEGTGAHGHERPTYEERLANTRGYSPNSSNIGNLKSTSYLEAMLQVYQQCYAVLKDGGLMVLVTKNFIRNKKQVDLAADTIKLCEQAGFTFQDRWYRELQSQSFWRIIYYQKYPDVEPIKYEDCLVFTKPAREGER